MTKNNISNILKHVSVAMNSSIFASQTMMSERPKREKNMVYKSSKTTIPPTMVTKVISTFK